MSISIKIIEGTTSPVVQTLWRMGIRTNDDLLPRIRTREQRQTFSAEVQADPGHLETLSIRADLARVPGIGRLYADLLMGAGILSVQQLAQQDPNVLHGRLSEIQERHRVVRRFPHPVDLAEWVEYARQLPVLLEH